MIYLIISLEYEHNLYFTEDKEKHIKLIEYFS